MSMTILGLAKSFVEERLSADQFANSYMEAWKYERDSDLLQKDDPLLGECLSTIFCLADLYNPEVDRDEYELDEIQFRLRVADLISNLKS